MLCITCLGMGSRGPIPRQILCAAHRGTLRHSIAHYNGRRSSAISPVHHDSSATAAESMLHSRARALWQLAHITGAYACCVPCERPSSWTLRHRLSIEVEFARRNAKLNETCYGARLRSPEPLLETYFP